MIVILTFVVVFAGCWILGFAGIGFFNEWQHCLRVALAAMFLLTASAHWGRMRADLVRMVPPAFPRPEMWVTLTGVAEIAGAIGLLWLPTVRVASIGLTLLLIALFPANVHAARLQLMIGGRRVPSLVPRTLMQIAFLGAVIAAGWC